MPAPSPASSTYHISVLPSACSTRFRIVVVRVYLHRERPRRVNQLDEQRKFAAFSAFVPTNCGCAANTCASVRPAHSPDATTDGPGLVAAQLPAFRQRRQIRPFAPVALEPFAAPDIILERGCKHQRALVFPGRGIFHRVVFHGSSFCARQRSKYRLKFCVISGQSHF